MAFVILQAITDSWVSFYLPDNPGRDSTICKSRLASMIIRRHQRPQVSRRVADRIYSRFRHTDEAVQEALYSGCF